MEIGYQMSVGKSRCGYVLGKLKVVAERGVGFLFVLRPQAAVGCARLSWLANCCVLLVARFRGLGMCVVGLAVAPSIHSRLERRTSAEEADVGISGVARATSCHTADE